MAWLRTAYLLVKLCWQRLLRYFYRTPSRYGRRKTPIEENINSFPRHPPKPERVKKEIIRLKALMPDNGCRTIALIFNCLYQQEKDMTVGKTYVSYTFVITNMKYR